MKFKFVLLLRFSLSTQGKLTEMFWKFFKKGYVKNSWVVNALLATDTSQSALSLENHRLTLAD